MLRMIVPAAALPPPVPVEADIVPLDLDDLPRLERLYARWPEAMFARSMFAPGLYFGALRRGELVAAAGAHALSARHGMGVVGTVFTDPAHRGSGLGTAVTGATVRALLAAGAREVALNVRRENRPAIATYMHLGFTVREDFFEAAITLR
jgi:ribosomal protein S18 acetylase RimI-like enzyme